MVSWVISPRNAQSLIRGVHADAGRRHPVLCFLWAATGLSVRALVRVRPGSRLYRSEQVPWPWSVRGRRHFGTHPRASVLCQRDGGVSCEPAGAARTAAPRPAPTAAAVVASAAATAGGHGANATWDMEGLARERGAPQNCSGHGSCGAFHNGTWDNPSGTWDDSAARASADGAEKRAMSQHAHPRTHCSGHGICKGGVCLCSDGWQGDACEVRRCERDCSGHGTCRVDGVCACFSGFGGPSCSELARRNECSGHAALGMVAPDVFGATMGGAVRTAARGRAPPGLWSPRRVCRRRMLLRRWLRRRGLLGVPLPIRLLRMAARHRCVCDEGWDGVECSERTCPAGCGVHQHCLDGACVCVPGRTGLALGCSLLSCPEGCGAHGRCSNGTCACDSGFTGPRCEEHACPMGGVGVEVGIELQGGAGVLECSGHGECVDGRCVCEHGFRSFDCSRRQCENECSAHGHCNSDGTCSCYQVVRLRLRPALVLPKLLRARRL